MALKPDAIVRKIVFVLIGLVYTPLVLLQYAWSIVKSKGKALAQVPLPVPSQLQDPKYGVHGFVTANGIKIHYVSSGTGPLVILLHGFPQSWFAWHNVIPRLQSNYRVVAIDMRGYGQSDKPSGVSSYYGATLAKDVNDVVHALGYDKCILMGHDWGGTVAWLVPHLYPGLVERLVIINAPHPKAFVANLSFSQFFKSWYIFFFQIPVVPELFLSLDNFGFAVTSVLGKRMGVRDRTHVNKDDVAVHQYQIALPGVLTAALNFYRATFNQPRFTAKTIDCPTLVIWGEEDGALNAELNNNLEKWVPNLTKKFLPGVSHWVPEEKPDVVAAAFLEFVKA